MNIFIADDHDIFRQSLTLLLENRSHHKVVGHAPSFNGLLEQAKKHRPDCMLLDYQMPGGDPATAIKQLRQAIHDIKIIVLTGIESSMALSQFTEGFCNGLLHKRDNAETLLQGVDQVELGNTFISPAIAEIIQAVSIQLTPREWQILTLMMQGKMLNTIADTLAISTRTVEKHKENMMAKCKVVNSIQLLEIGHKLLAPDFRP